MAGRVPQGADRAAVKGEMETVFVENLKHAAGVLAQENLVGLLEPINTRITDPQYFLDTPRQAAAILQKVGRPNLQLQMDIFHWQIMDGNLTGNIREFLPTVGHVQVAQVPDRGEPGSSGELDFTYLFQLLEDEGYQGFVGCEYRPRGDTVEGLSWLRSYWDRRGRRPRELLGTRLYPSQEAAPELGGAASHRRGRHRRGDGDRERGKPHQHLRV